MKAVLIAVATLLAVPALAQGGSDVQPSTFGRPSNPGYPPNGNPGTTGYPPPPNGNPGTPGYPPAVQGTPVVVDRETLMQQLANINDKLAQASVRAKKDKQQQKQIEDARTELKDVARLVTNAPLAQQQQPQRPPPPQSPPPQPSVQPITEAMLRQLVTAVRNEPFADDQLDVLADASSSQYFLVSQTQQLLSIFSFSKDRLKAVRLVRPHLLDPENGFKLYESFEYSKDKEELKRILATQTP
jgi:hypothetical protein